MKLKRFAKLIRAGPSDPAFDVTFANSNLHMYDYGKRRVGRPRLNWIRETRDLFWEKVVQSKFGVVGPLDVASKDHVHFIYITAH